MNGLGDPFDDGDESQPGDRPTVDENCTFSAKKGRKVAAVPTVKRSIVSPNEAELEDDPIDLTTTMTPVLLPTSSVGGGQPRRQFQAPDALQSLPDKSLETKAGRSETSWANPKASLSRAESSRTTARVDGLLEQYGSKALHDHDDDIESTMWPPRDDQFQSSSMHAGRNRPGEPDLPSYLRDCRESSQFYSDSISISHTSPPQSSSVHFPKSTQAQNHTTQGLLHRDPAIYRPGDLLVHSGDELSPLKNFVNLNDFKDRAEITSSMNPFWLKYQAEAEESTQFNGDATSSPIHQETQFQKGGRGSSQRGRRKATSSQNHIQSDAAKASSGNRWRGAKATRWKKRGRGFSQSGRSRA
jgi:hypothetical protein